MSAVLATNTFSRHLSLRRVLSHNTSLCAANLNIKNVLFFFSHPFKSTTVPGRAISPILCPSSSMCASVGHTAVLCGAMPPLEFECATNQVSGAKSRAALNGPDAELSRRASVIL